MGFSLRLHDLCLCVYFIYSAVCEVVHLSCVLMLSVVLQCASEAEHMSVKEECAEEDMNDPEDRLSEFKHKHP